MLWKSSTLPDFFLQSLTALTRCEAFFLPANRNPAVPAGDEKETTDGCAGQRMVRDGYREEGTTDGCAGQRMVGDGYREEGCREWQSRPANVGGEEGRTNG